MAYLVANYINGKIQKPNTKTKKVFNPATGKAEGKVCLSDKATVTLAIKSAQKAYPTWAAVPAARRAKILFEFKKLVEDNLNNLAKLISQEHGKTVPDALGEIARGIEVIDYCIGIAELLKGEYSRGVATGVDTHNDRMPLGVVAGITPFNFPAMVPMWMFVPAIACGNTFVLKPSERDPSASIFCAQLLAKAGLPNGVFNVVQGDKVAVDTLLTNKDVKAVSFVGSTPIAKYIYEVGAKHGKRVQALGGAKNHMVVLPDADLEQASDALMGAVYGSAGERCMAISVAVAVGKKTADGLIAKLKPRVEKLKIGPGTAKDIEMGPLVTKEHKEKVVGYINQGVKEGAKLVVDGRKVASKFKKGFFLGGSIFDNVTCKMKIYQEEIFGPVLVLLRVNNAAEALSLVNEHQYGNGAAIFTRDGMAARQFSEQVEAGMVGVNVPIPVPVGYHSFGGWKDSLFGSNAIYGPEGIKFYTRLKTITSRWPGSKRIGAEFTFPQLGK